MKERERERKLAYSVCVGTAEQQIISAQNSSFIVFTGLALCHRLEPNRNVAGWVVFRTRGTMKAEYKLNIHLACQIETKIGVQLNRNNHKLNNTTHLPLLVVIQPHIFRNMFPSFKLPVQSLHALVLTERSLCQHWAAIIKLKPEAFLIVFLKDIF